MASLVLILLVAALVCWVLAAANASIGINLDAASKACLVGALLAHLY